MAAIVSASRSRAAAPLSSGQTPRRPGHGACRALVVRGLARGRRINGRPRGHEVDMENVEEVRRDLVRVPHRGHLQG